MIEAVQSVVLYGAEVWIDSLTRKIYNKKLTHVQRRIALRVASASHGFRAGCLVVAGTKARLSVEEETAHREARKQMMERWLEKVQP